MVIVENKALKDRMNEKKTEELKEIYVLNDYNQWTEEAFRAIEEILKERDEEIPKNLEQCYAVFVIKENKISDIEEDRNIWEKANLSESDGSTAKKINMEKLIDWQDCEVSEEGYPSFECQQCKKKYGLDLSAISSDEDLRSRSLIFTGNSEEVSSDRIIIITRIITVFFAVLIGSSVSALFGSPPLVYAILAVILYYLLGPVILWFFSKINIGRQKFDYWFFKCPNCSNKIVIMTDGNQAAFIEV